MPTDSNPREHKPGLMVYDSTADMQASFLKHAGLEFSEVAEMYAESLHGLRELARHSESEKIKLAALIKLSLLLPEFTKMYEQAAKLSAQGNANSLPAHTVGNPFTQDNHQ